ADAVAGVLVTPAPPAGTHVFGDEVHTAARGLVDQARELGTLCGRRRSASLSRGGGLAQEHVAARADVCRRAAHADVPGLGDGADIDLHIAQDVCLARGPLDRVLQRPRTQDAEAGGQLVVPFERTADDG